MRPDSTSASHGSRLPSGDAGDIVLGWLTKIMVLLAVLGVMAFDAVSLGSSYVQTEDAGQQAARRAAERYSLDKDLQAAYDAALLPLLARGDTIDPDSFSVSPDGAVTLTISHQTPTLLVEKIPPLREYAVVEATVTGRQLR